MDYDFCKGKRLMDLGPWQSDGRGYYFINIFQKKAILACKDI